MSDLLLDSYTLIQISRDQPVSEAAEAAMNRCYRSGNHVYVSPISAWTLGLLVSRNRLRLSLPVTDWFERYRQESQCHLAELSPRILAESSFLPGQPPVDPAGRVLIATAREMNLVLITSNQEILMYANEGHVRAIAS